MQLLVVCVIAAAYIGKSWSLPTSVACPNCKYVGYQLINIPRECVSDLRNFLSPFDQFNDVKCVKNSILRDVCPAPSQENIPNCFTLWVKMRAIGIRAANLPASGIELVVVTRSCGYQANFTANICKSIYDAPLEALNAFMIKVELEKSFDSVKVHGQFCQSTTGNTTLDKLLNFPNNSKPVAACSLWASILCLLCVMAFV